VTGRVARLAKAAIIALLSCAVVAGAAGGWEFVRRPVGIVLLVVCEIPGTSYEIIDPVGEPQYASVGS